MDSKEQRYFDFFERDRFAKGIGIKLLEARPGYAKAEMTVADRHLNGADVLHGGAIFTLADFCFAVASNTHGQVALSINASINFIKAVSSGRIYAVAKELSLSHKLGTYMIEVFDGSDALVASMQGTVYRKRDLIKEFAD